MRTEMKSCLCVCGGGGLDIFGSGYRTEAGFFGPSYEHSDFIKGGEILY
jgi:hypothetical protein